MNKIRVLIVDDSVVVRRFVSDVLAADPSIEVVGTAPNGRIALARIPQLAPDLITLDLEMPDLDGLETLRALRKDYPRLPVIMLSRFTQRCSEATLDALALGATDYVPLPEHGSLAGARACLAEQLLPRIKQLGGGCAPPTATPAARPSRMLPPRLEVVAIGASTGGPNALATLLGSFPAPFPIPVVIVQHMPPTFTRQLADRLAHQTNLDVREGVAGGVLEPGVVWIAPGDYHMTVQREGAEIRLHLLQTPPEQSCRPAVDVLFRSVAGVYGPAALAVVLTGMGQDGLRGCEAIREVGGQVVVQDKASSVVWGMPGNVAQAGLAQQVLPLPHLAPEILTRVLRGRSRSSLGGPAPVPTE